LPLPSLLRLAVILPALVVAGRAALVPLCWHAFPPDPPSRAIPKWNARVDVFWRDVEVRG
jgi:hypothetical protein